MGAVLTSLKINLHVFCVVFVALPLYLAIANIMVQFIQISCHKLNQLEDYKQYAWLICTPNKDSDYKLIHVLLVAILLGLLSVFALMVHSYTEQSAWRHFRVNLMSEAARQQKEEENEETKKNQ